jgi:hypothetical protein
MGLILIKYYVECLLLYRYVMGLVEQIWLTYVEEVYQVRYLFLEIRFG